MKALITGGGGFLGSHLSAALARLGHDVRILDRKAPAADEATPDWVVGDASRSEEIDGALADREVVFHLAGTTYPKTSNDDPGFDVHSNVEGSLVLLDAARRRGVRRVVFVSSGGTVYGRPLQVPIAEDHPTHPISSYGITKLAIENYLVLYRELYGLDYCILRLSNPYGEHQMPDRAQGAVAVFLDRILRGQPIEIWGDGSVVRDYVYVGDAIAGIVRGAETDAPSRLYNIGSGRGTSLSDLIAEIETATGRRANVTFKPGRAFDVPTNILDITRAKAELGWQPQVPLGDGLERTLAWLKSR